MLDQGDRDKEEVASQQSNSDNKEVDLEQNDYEEEEVKTKIKLYQGNGK